MADLAVRRGRRLLPAGTLPLSPGAVNLSAVDRLGEGFRHCRDVNGRDWQQRPPDGGAGTRKSLRGWRAPEDSNL